MGSVAIVVVLAVAAACVGPTDRAGAAGTTERATAKRPNIVMIMTDDQNLESMRVLTKVHQLLADKGVTFANNVVSFSLCCPSRATYLTGQYAHNHHVHGNIPPAGGYSLFAHQDTTFPVALQKAGYDTVHIGKYLNGYGLQKPVPVPPGWTDWHGSIDPTTYRYYGFTLMQHGKPRTYPKRKADYQADVYTDIATSEIRARARSKKPYFLNVAYLAPHAQAGSSTAAGADGNELHAAIPAPRDAHRFDHTPLPRSAAYDEADVSDKPAGIRALPRITPKVRRTITTNYDKYLGSLLAVDDGVARIMKTLAQTHQLRNTIVMFTSDNGFLFGEHRITAGKVFFYEPSIRVPLIVRGPGIPQGVTRQALVANIDLAPSILDLAGATPLRVMDGQSFVPLLHSSKPAQPDRAIVLESGSPYSPNKGLRTPRYAYFEDNTGERELYDLRTDPNELVNRHGDPAYAAVEQQLASRLLAMRYCAGAACQG